MVRRMVRGREWRQEGSGRARSFARALLNWFCQGQALGEVQGEAAGLADEPSCQGEEVSSKGLGGCHRLAQTDARGPARQIVGHYLDGQPSGVGGEASRGEMVETHPVLEVADGVLDLGVAAMVGLQSEGVALAVGDAAVIAVGGAESQLGAVRGFPPIAIAT